MTTPADRASPGDHGRERRTVGMTPADVALQMVLTVSQPHDRLGKVLEQLAPYSPELVTGWSLTPKEGEILVRLFQFGTMPPEELIDQLNKPDGVHLERNTVMNPSVVPNDPLYQDRWAFYKPQWALRKMSAEQAWDCAPAMGPAAPIVVAVIDSGITQAHPDLAARVNSLSTSVIPSSVGVEDEDGHGTFLAGTIAAITDDAFGIASATWPIAVSLLAVKFYNPRYQLNAAYACKAIAYAVDVGGAKVINASWHIGMPAKLLALHIRYARDKDVLFVAAGGNEGTDNDQLPIWPASYPIENIVAVMATNRHDERPAFSNYGANTMHIAAPGVRILSTHYYLSQVSAQPPRWREYSGTSAAAAHVTAAAAIIRAFEPTWKVPQVKARLLASVDTFSGLKCITRGRLNLEKVICGPPPL